MGISSKKFVEGPVNIVVIFSYEFLDYSLFSVFAVSLIQQKLVFSEFLSEYLGKYEVICVTALTPYSGT
jgi:hypothetical protein